jgi:RyR domain/TrkA-N domain
MAKGSRERGSGWRPRLPLPVYRPLLRFLVVLAIALAALILGGIGLHQYLYQPSAQKIYGHGFWDIVFYDLQLPVLSSAPAQGPGPYPVTLGVARILAPAGTFLAAVGTLGLLLGEQWRRLRAATATRHAIVAGDGPVALELAGRLHAERRQVVLVSSSDATLTQARRGGLLEVRGDPADPGTLRAAGVARARELYACAALGTVNAAIALRARDEVRAARRRPLAAYAMVRDVELGVALRARRIGVAGDSRLRLDFFDVEDIAARKLFDAYPLTPGGHSSVVIVGFGQLGRAILREIARRYQPVPGALPIDVAIRHATAATVREVIAAFPAIASSCSVSYGTEPELAATGEYTVFVCVDGDDDALREGLAMAHSLASRRGHVVVCMRESSPFAGVLAARSGLVDDVMGRLSVFGVIEEACVPANIRDDFTEQLARSIHSAYVAMETAKGETPETNPSMVRWEQLSEDLRQSNIAQAADIGVKMDAIGAIVVPESAGAPAFSFTDQEIERLARMEHERWLKEKIADGWKYGEVRDDERKIHPDLKDWAGLSDAERGKDRNAVRTLPATLHDAGYQILRLPAS